jgi:hypothetical protein
VLICEDDIAYNAPPLFQVMMFSSHQIVHEHLLKVDAALLKSCTDNVQLLANIKRLLGVD